MFKDNKYTKWYFAIIKRATERTLDGYCERHHAIPKCLGGTNDKNNLVYLTAREHFICHLLLMKMHSSNKLKYALIMMMARNPHQEDRHIPNARVYEKIKKLNSELASAKFTGKQKHNVGKVRVYNPASGKYSMSHKDKIPVGWVQGWAQAHKDNMKGKNVGKKYYYDPVTMESIAIGDGDPIPNGFLRGNISGIGASKKAADRNKGTILYHDPVTMETLRSKICPDGWVKGSPHIWITNGNESKQQLKNEPLPDGWYVGRSKWRNYDKSESN